MPSRLACTNTAARHTGSSFVSLLVAADKWRRRHSHGAAPWRIRSSQCVRCCCNTGCTCFGMRLALKPRGTGAAATLRILLAAVWCRLGQGGRVCTTGCGSGSDLVLSRSSKRTLGPALWACQRPGVAWDGELPAMGSKKPQFAFSLWPRSGPSAFLPSTRMRMTVTIQMRQPWEGTRQQQARGRLFLRHSCMHSRRSSPPPRRTGRRPSIPEVQQAPPSPPRPPPTGQKQGGQ